jgi:DNA-binding MltR family transcriptional regulator
MDDQNENSEASFLSGKTLERYWYRIKALEEFSKLFTYNTGDDRAIVIIGSAFLETILEHILIEFFPEGEKEVDILLSYDKPLGTYSNKVRMIYCLGLIEKKIMKDLKLIGKIRNRFAHDLSVSFEDKDITNWTRELKWHREIFFLHRTPKDATTRDIYQVGVNTVISYLNGIVGKAISQKRVIIDSL